jgi:thiol:disulfide interchange protein DsbD
VSAERGCEAAGSYVVGKASLVRALLGAVVLACVVRLASAAVAVEQPPAGAADPAVEAKWRVLSQSPSNQGVTELALTVTIAPGWHVNAHDPDRPYLIPTELQVDVPAAMRVEEVRYPDAVIRALAFSGSTPLRLYEGAFTIGVRLNGRASGSIRGRLRYQACNDERCLPPRVLPVTLVLRGSGEAVAPADIITPRTSEGGSYFERWIHDKGLVATLAIAALFGLGLNLTPCVYPLISVTIAYFGGQSRHATRKVALLASAYVLGIALTFSALGVSAALSGGLFGSALQRPVVLAGIAGVLVVLAASNFGVYQLSAPAVLTQRFGRTSTGLAGALFMGCTMGIVAAPCVGPIIVALLLFVATRQDAALGFALFFALALGMGAPYVALAMAAGSIKRLPRSGEWLVWVEHLFGFVLLGMALYFARPVLGEGMTRAAMPVLMAVAGVYLGFIGRVGRSFSFAVTRGTVGVAAIGGAVWLALPHQAESAITWEPFSPPALVAAKGAGRPAVVDFTAAWCLPCRENDTITFMDPAVGAEASRFVMLRADVTETTEEVERWMAAYAVLGVPTIVFYGSSGVEEARTVGFVEPERFLALMRERR